MDASRTDPSLLRAIAHPLRLAILECLQARIASPAELAVELHEPIDRVKYHVEVLVGCDCLELMETRAREGSSEPFYLAKVPALMGNRELLKAQLSERGAMSGPALGSCLEQAGAGSVEARQIGKQGTVGTISIELDQFGWTAATELLEGFLTGMEQLHQQSLARVKATGRPGSLAIISCALFDPADASPAGLDLPPE